MVVLDLYNSEDVDCTNKLCSLNNGYHFVGRETPIISNNKMISRRHAKIVVHKNGAIIESIHVNPTFFKSSVGGSIQLLKEHESLSLNSGDCFALLEDAIWFRVKIIQEHSEEPLTDEQSHNPLGNKRGNDEDIADTNKRIKMEIDDSLDTTTDSSKVAGTALEESGVADANLTTNGTNVPNCNNIETDLDSTIEELNVAAASSTVNVTNVENVLNCNNIKTEQPETDSTLEGVAVEYTVNNTQNVQNPGNIKTEKPDDDDSTDYLPMPLPLPEIKQEPLTDGLHNPASTNNEPPDQVISDQPSSSTNDNIPAWRRDHPDWRRDRCWYGKDCYRKNPIHKEDFSHPSDNDYDSDPKDNRIVCPFGRSCYRTNIQHRRQFKHFGKPAPRPNTLCVNGCPCCNNSRNKPGYESDCEHTDPE